MSETKILTEEEIISKVEFLSSHRCNHTPHKYIDITGDLIAGTLLSQIMYWFTDGKNRVSIYKDGHYWIAKRREDWMSEIRITQKQYDCAIKKLTGEIEPTEEEKKQKWNKGKRREKKYDMGNRLVEVKTYHFYGIPTTHIRPITENINRKIDEWKKELEDEIRNQNGHQCNANLPNGNLVNSPNSNLEITETENSYNIYNNINNTDTEITNNDYTTETTYNSFSDEKEQCASDEKQPEKLPDKKPERKNRKKEANELFEKLWKLYPLKKGKGSVSDFQKIKILDIGYDELERAIQRYKQYVDSIDYLHYKNGSTFFNSGYVDYLDANYEEQNGKSNEQNPDRDEYAEEFYRMLDGD